MIAAQPKASVFTIAPGLSFVEALAEGILGEAAGDAEALARVRVLLPTRRACRSLSDAFLRLTDGKPTLLPQMMPLGDVDADELLVEGALDLLSDSPLSLPPAIDTGRRTLLLAKLVLAKENDQPPDQAVRLAGELAKLLDQITTERLDLGALGELVPKGELSEHWQQTLDFLDILHHHWPDVLKSEGAIDPAERRNRLLEARRISWLETPPDTPIIAAGSTGSIPATADLLAAIAALPAGRVVLPGLDLDTPDDVWQSLGPGHAQSGMARLLKHMKIGRADVQPWPWSGPGKETSTARAALINRALVPAAGAHLWREAALPDGDALDGVQVIDAPTPQDEAEAIALVMRQTLETPEKTAALITPDQNLARRVIAELGRWNITVESSAGQPLAKTPPGAFFEQVAEAAASGLQPVALLACLKHPLAKAGSDDDQFRRNVRAMEVGLLRGPRPGGGLKGLENAFRVMQGDERKLRRLAKMGLSATAIRDVLAHINETIGPFAEALAGGKVDGSILLRLHVRAAESLAGELWAGEAGAALVSFINETLGTIDELGPVRGADYAPLLGALMAGRVVRTPYARHPRLFIWGLLEARLQRADVTILGGLNENTWPPEAKASPWMSRPMMRAFGLPLPERRIGLTAHDFTQAFSAPEVVLTRAARVEGTPQVPSRWLVRLETLLEGTASGEAFATAKAGPWLDWARQLNHTESQPCEPPLPKPAVELRPRALSVTRIETWIRDPYAIYARHVLGLEPLDALDAEPGAADRGTLIHDAMERFIRANMDSFPDDLEKAEAELLRIGGDVFRETASSPAVRAFWWPRFQRIARWFVVEEKARRDAGQHPLVVVGRGELAVNNGEQDFTLSARADRIDANVAGALVIIDYKTGEPPTKPMVETGLNPQLPLEAAIALGGGFSEIQKPRGVAELVYIKLAGGLKAGKVTRLKLDAEEAAEVALTRLKGLVALFDKETTPYPPRLRPMKERPIGDYDHLSRFKEWGSAEGESE